MSMTFEEKVVDAFQASSAALARYEKIAQEKQAQDTAVAKEVPEVVDALLRFGRIDQPRQSRERRIDRRARVGMGAERQRLQSAIGRGQ